MDGFLNYGIILGFIDGIRDGTSIEAIPDGITSEDLKDLSDFLIHQGDIFKRLSNELAQKVIE